MKTPATYAILLAGGTGTRFWPASRRRKPKQFLRVAGANSLLEETRARLAGVIDDEHVLVVTTEEHASDVHAALPSIPRENVLAEPLGRNTGPCIALAALEVRRRDPGALQVVLPADHVIRPREDFQRTLRAALQVASDGRSLIVFGIAPDHAATAFGWIKSGALERSVDGLELRAVERFTEKPSRERARAFLAEGGYFWNSGMFVWSTAAICAALELHLPRVFAALARGPRGAELARAYAAFEPVSIDVGVIERAEHVRMLPIDYFWSDVGAWDALAGVLDSDARNNVAAGGTLLKALESKGCIVHGPEGSLTALIGVDNLIVVQAGGVTLVCRRDRAQDVKRLVERLASEAPEFT